MIMDLLTNKIFMSTAASWFVAQLLKVIISTAKEGFSKERLTGSGGMPSSHSATVTGLLLSTILVEGFGGFPFAMAFFFAIIVIYDAAGVRMETGREARALNRLMDRDAKEGKEPIYEGRFREKMGHTYLEIFAGIALGIVITLLTCQIISGLVL